MSSAIESIRGVADEALPQASVSAPPRYRVWPAVLAAAIYWSAFGILGLLSLGMFSQFLGRMAALGVWMVAWTIWWLTRRGISRTERFLVVGSALAGGIIATLLLHPTVVPPAVLFLALPTLFSLWTAWLVAASWISDRARLWGMLVIPILVWIPTTLVRMEGLSGMGQPVLHWRWTRSAEAEFLASKPSTPEKVVAAPTPSSAEAVLTASPDDWTGFRGPARDGVVHGVKIASDWQASPPELVWKKRVGPAWSSLVVVGQRLFTQEQRGDVEVVVCVDAQTGDELWVHEDTDRFEENLGGIGPRATPTFADGRIYALGAAGRLNCLDAVTGQEKWTRSITADASAKPPMWGFSGSPLITNGVVIVFAGGKGKHGLLAYRADTGGTAWNVSAGQNSYSSPQIASLGGVEQVLFLSDTALHAVDPATGTSLWSYECTQSNVQPALQPHVTSGSEVLISFNPDSGTTALEVTPDAQKWRVEPKWTSRSLKPFFNDFVQVGDSLYGFDGNIFCCLDAQTGNRRWKGGRYGNGQVLLIADQDLLLVLAETGEAVLLEANPEKLVELGRFTALHGKTWNHPVIAGQRLYVRNADEMACYRLKPL